MTSLDAVLDRLTASYPELSPQLKQAAKFALDMPAEIAINSMRSVAAAAGVGPSTMLRLAKKLGFPSYDAFRLPFQQAMRSGGGSFADRAEWLRSLGRGAREGNVLGSMAEAGISNVETAFQTADPDSLVRAADLLRQARKSFAFCGGALRPFAEYFHAVCRLVLPNAVLVGSVEGAPIDDLVAAGPQDALLTISCDPYAEATVRGVDFAVSRGVPLIAITDSRASPIAQNADELIIVPTASPQFFPSQVAVVAMVETLIALIVLRSDASTVERIQEIERLRIAEGVYWRPQRD